MIASRRLHHVFLPHAGGAGADLLGIAKTLCEAPNRHLLELPGRGRRRREPLVHDCAIALDDLDARLKARFAATDLTGNTPVLFLGHSFGAYMAWMLARRHSARHPFAPVVVVALSNRPLHIRRRFHVPHGVSRARDAALFSELVAFVETLGNIPEVIRATPNLFERFMAVLAADLAVADGLPWDLAALQAPLPLITGHGETDPVCQIDQDRWAQLGTGPHFHFTLPGGHFLPMDSTAALARILTGSDIYRRWAVS
ncbi:MAG: alpha/beta fold hydrolase [Pseudomonadota bacterium]